MLKRQQTSSDNLTSKLSYIVNLGQIQRNHEDNEDFHCSITASYVEFTSDVYTVRLEERNESCE